MSPFSLCKFWNRNVQQISEIPMRFPLFPVVTDIFIESLEAVVIESLSHKPKYWFQYVDHTCIVWHQG